MPTIDVAITETVQYAHSFELTELEEAAGMSLAEAGSLDALVAEIMEGDLEYTESVVEQLQNSAVVTARVCYAENAVGGGE